MTAGLENYSVCRHSTIENAENVAAALWGNQTLRDFSISFQKGVTSDRVLKAFSDLLCTGTRTLRTFHLEGELRFIQQLGTGMGFSRFKRVRERNQTLEKMHFKIWAVEASQDAMAKTTVAVAELKELRSLQFDVHAAFMYGVAFGVAWCPW